MQSAGQPAFAELQISPRRRTTLDVLLRDLAHRVLDWNVCNALSFVDPARAVQPLHFPVIKTFHVDGRTRLQLRLRECGKREG